MARNEMRRTAFLMPVFNPRPDELARTLASMVAQTEPADIVIVDDGSTPPVLLPPGIDATVLRLARNAGITAALNHGLAHIAAQDYTYVARMDCGDICKPERIAVQQAHMERHPDLDLIGAFAEIVDTQGRHLFVEGTAGGPAAIRRKLFDNAAFKHPTFFFRVRSVARLGDYATAYPCAEDYELAVRFAQHGRVHCLDDVLLIYEKSDAGLSSRNRRLQLWSRLRIQLAWFQPLRAASWLGVLRTIVTLMVPARAWAGLSRLYWRRRARRRAGLMAG
jgi:glycosyltransferase involved in cell wall biosynthesis